MILVCQAHGQTPTQSLSVQLSDLKVTVSQDGTPTVDSLYQLSEKISTAEDTVKVLRQHMTSQEDHIKYYAALRDLAKLKSQYYQLWAAVDPDESSIAKATAWRLEQDAIHFQAHVYAMSDVTPPKVVEGGRLHLVQ
jgi:hypothetical protein